MHILEDLNYVLEDMIEPIAKKQDISPTELDNVYKAVKTMNYIESIKAMKEYGNSNDGSYSYGGGSYARNNRNRNSNDYYRTSYDGRMGMDGDGDGRYSERRYSRARYSRADEREMMLSKLERMMDDANSEAERQTIKDCIRKIESEG